MRQKAPAKAAQHKVGTYGLISKFPGYNARGDKTTLPLGTLISPSQNVVTNTSGRVALVKGYALDGDGSTAIDSGILSNFDFVNFKGDVRNMRAGFLTSAGNDGKLQYRYLDATNVVNWVTLKSSLTNVRLSYTSFTDTTEKIKIVLWVDGTNNIFEWNGAVTTFASATATTVTKQGTNTWTQEGFYQTKSPRSITINGVTATYTGGEGTTTLTGVSVDFSATSVASIIHQTPVTTALAAMTAITATFSPTLVGSGKDNQLYVGTNNSNSLYISKVNDYTNYTFSVPLRVVGEGDLKILDAPPVKIIAQEVQGDKSSYDMYISQGLDTWSVIRATLSGDLLSESLDIIRLKVSSLQGAKSERLVTKVKNHIMFVGNDNVANFFGYLSYQFVPEITDFSYRIIDDMNSYDFTDGSAFYYKNYVYITVPKSGLIRIFNMTDQTKQSTQSIRAEEEVDPDQPWYWEAPVTYAISGFYVVNGELYGHSYTTSESYKLFTGGSLNGQQIDANATFSYDDKGDRTQSKGSDEIWLEGYIKQNTKLNVAVSGDLDSFATSQTVVVDGSDSRIVAYGSGAHSLGTTPLGSAPLGGSSTLAGSLPAWFHCVKTYPQVPFYLESVSLTTKGADLQWELLAYGTNARETPEGNSYITE